jgi:hypothetical protein
MLAKQPAASDDCPCLEGFYQFNCHPLHVKNPTPSDEISLGRGILAGYFVPVTSWANARTDCREPLSRFNKINGRHEETRTPDLYRVKVAL